MPDLHQVLAGGRGWPEDRPPRSAAARARASTRPVLPVVLAGLGLLASCSQGTSGAPPISPPAERHVYGVLSGDASARCVWITPGDRGSTRSPVEVRLPRGVTVTYTPTVTLATAGRTLHTGDPVIVEDLGPAASRPGCPLAAGHTTINAGAPNRWNGIVQVTPPPKRKTPP